MKSISRFLLGLISSVLFAAGLQAAADRVDPISRSLANDRGEQLLKSAPDSGTYCRFTDEHS